MSKGTVLLDGPRSDTPRLPAGPVPVGKEENKKMD